MSTAASQSRLSIGVRVAIGLVLLGLYCVLALALVAAFLIGAVLLYRDDQLAYAVILLLGGLAAAWIVLPRPVRTAVPGTRIRVAEQPELFDVIDEVARDVGVAPVDAVHLAFMPSVAILQQGSRRVLLLGLPFLVGLDETELRAVLAHEYAHYRGGDLRAARWTWRTQMALGRALERFGGREKHWILRLLCAPFALFALVFVGVTAAVRRREELAADAVAARVAGRAATADGLRAVAALTHAWDWFCANELDAALADGDAPPVLAAFDRARRTARLDQVVHEAMERELSALTDRWSTHPALRERLDALGRPAAHHAGAPVSGLIRGIAAVELAAAPALAELQAADEPSTASTQPAPV
jgi:Zn-dependent protease with chaperone function